MFLFFDIIVYGCNQTSAEEKKVTVMLPKYRGLTLGASIQRAEQDGKRIERGRARKEWRGRTVECLSHNTASPLYFAEL